MNCVNSDITFAMQIVKVVQIK